MGMENMEKKLLFEHVTHLENQLGDMYTELGSIKQHIAHLVEENHHLFLENERLRAKLSDLVSAPNDRPEKGEKVLHPQTDPQPMVGEGYDNLARLYNEGFHICHPHFGGLRTENDCLFCLSILKK